MIKILTLLIATAGFLKADRLENTYLPPFSARSAGGNNFLSPPHYSSSTTGSTSARIGSQSHHTKTYSGSSSPVAILRLNNDNNGDGTYRFDYQTDNHISHEEFGHLKNAGTEQESNVVQGSYSYTAPDGVTYTVNYIADENGFRATGDHLPTPPPIPDVILKSLETNTASSGGFGRTGYQTNQPSKQYLTPDATHRQSSGYHY